MLKYICVYLHSNCTIMTRKRVKLHSVTTEKFARKLFLKNLQSLYPYVQMSVIMKYERVDEAIIMQIYTQIDSVLRLAWWLKPAWQGLQLPDSAWCDPGRCAISITALSAPARWATSPPTRPVKNRHQADPGIEVLNPQFKVHNYENKTDRS